MQYLVMYCDVPGFDRLVARQDLDSCTCNSTGRTAMAEGSTAGSYRLGKQSHWPDKPQQQEWPAFSLVAVVYKLTGFHQWRKHMLHPWAASSHRERYLNVGIQSGDGHICRTLLDVLIVLCTKSRFSSPRLFSPRISPQASDFRPTLCSHPRAMNITASQDRRYIATRPYEEGE
jgi:hypothetical protein